jgi:hypothetical protein
MPDYVSACAGVGPLFGGSGCVAIDRYGGTYAGLSFEYGFRLTPVSGSVTYGWINTSVFYSRHWTQIPPTAEIAAFVGGFGGGVSANLVFGAGASWNWDEYPDLEHLATEITYGTPAVNWTIVNLMFPLGYDPELSWHWIDMYPVLSGRERSSIRLEDNSPVDCGC